MKLQWHNLLFKIIIWLTMEIILTFLGFDDIADYSEYVLENKHYNYSQLETRTFKLS